MTHNLSEADKSEWVGGAEQAALAVDQAAGQGADRARVGRRTGEVRARVAGHSSRPQILGDFHFGYLGRG